VNTQLTADGVPTAKFETYSKLWLKFKREDGEAWILFHGPEFDNQWTWVWAPTEGEAQANSGKRLKSYAAARSSLERAIAKTRKAA
jgi:hypothetical protein